MNEDTSCRQLWATVLLHAMDDVGGSLVDCNSIYNRQRYIAEAREWFERDEDGIGSFRFVCHALCLNTASVRDAVLNGETRFDPPEPDPDSLAFKLLSFRQHYNLRQGHVAKAVGIAVSSISCVETGRTNEHAMREDHRERIIDYMTEFEELHEPDFVCQR